MWRVRLGIAFGMVVVLFSSALGAKTQSEYRALLYDNANGIIRELDATGAVVDSVQLPMPGGYGVYSFNIAFDSAYRYAAYVVSDPPGTRYQFRVYGYADGRTHVVYSVNSPIYSSLNTSPSPYQLFNDAGLVAFSYNLNNAGYFTHRWNLVIFDINSGALKYSINDQYFPYPLENDQLLPIPYSLDDSKLVFGIPQMFDTPDHWSSAVYHWLFNTGEVMQARFDRSQKYDEASERLITFWQSPDLTYTESFFPNQLWMQVGNDIPEDFYTDPDLSFTDVYFVEAGARVLVHAITPTMQRMDEQWLLLDLDGQLSMTLPLGFRADKVQSTLDGFVYTLYDNIPGISDLYHVNTTSGGFNATLIASDIPGRLIGLREDTGTESRPPLQVQPLFRVGDRVMITPAGNQLRMRATPGGEVQRQFNAGAVVTIVGGPTEFTRTVWWQVRDENAMVGWIAQGNDEVSYLALAQ